ncbi:MAG: mechanosensitive ion channel [Coxiellaceae bacterium]|nr:mechanosensitive ion channel [Coxiellaceae bacterium]
MKKILLLIACFLIQLTVSAVALSQDAANNHPPLNIKHANATLDNIVKQITSSKSNSPDLAKLLNKLLPLLENANDCISQTEEQLDDINQAIKSNGLSQANQSLGEDHKYLTTKRKSYEQKLSSCRYIAYRTKEVLVSYKQSMQRYNQSQLLKHSTPIWKIHEDSVRESFNKINIGLIQQTSGLSAITLTQYILALVFTLITLLFTTYIRLLCRQWLIKNRNKGKHLYSFIKVVSIYLIPTAVFAVLSAYCYILFSNTFPNPGIENACYALAIFFLLCAFCAYIFSPTHDSHSIIKLPPAVSQRFYIRSVTVLTWLLLGYLVSLVFTNQSIHAQFFELSRTVYITILSGLIFWLFILLVKVPHIKNKNNAVPLFIKIALCCLLVVLVCMEWFGYHQLAVYLITSALLTVVLSLATMAVCRIIAELVNCLDNSNLRLSRGIRHIISIKFHRKIHEIILIEYVCYLVVIALFIICLMHVWQVSGNHIDDFISALSDGFFIADLKITPVRIMIGVISFSLILLVGRAIATFVAKKEHFDGEKDTQVAISSIIIYLSACIALIIMLLMIGVNFTGLAIIAGALSVGIGLGLQTIVNNFVSGIILLLEKPIKPGDRIVVGDTEGFVKKIRIRSTQVKTLAKEDVIFPNADLVTQKVTNYMFRDHNWRVVCQVGVAYGSDVERVKKVLLEVAANHPDVEQKEPNHPAVLFRNFGDSSLIFELWCIINDVNKKFIIASDLNFSIDQAFRQNDIVIAFPQRDVHMK